MTEAEYLDDTPKSAAKVAKTSAPQANPSASDMLFEDSEANEQVDPEHIIEVDSGISSSYVSLDSSEFDEPTQSLIDELNKRSETVARSVPQKTDSANQQSHKTNPTSTSFYPIPLQMILPEPVAETVVPASVQVTASEPSAAVTIPKHTSTKTPQKATKSVPKKTDSVNQQQPQPIQQTTPEPSNAQTQTSTPTQISTQQLIIPEMTIPEPAAETMVPESVPVTESEPSVSIADSEPTQTLSTTLTTND